MVVYNLKSRVIIFSLSLDGNIFPPSC